MLASPEMVSLGKAIRKKGNLLEMFRNGWMFYSIGRAIHKGK
jgi:hypothetical protein